MTGARTSLVSADEDAAVVRRYVRWLQRRASAASDMSDDAIADHDAEVLWALARAICGEGLVAHAPLLRRASLDLLEQGGRRLCGEAECLTDSTPPRDRGETDSLRALGLALLEMRARFELQQ